MVRRSGCLRGRGEERCEEGYYLLRGVVGRRDEGVW